MFARTRRFLNRRKNRVADTAGKVFNTKEVRQNWSLIKELRMQVFQRSSSNREETFRSAYKRMALTEDKLAGAHRYYMTRFYIFAVFASLSLGGFVYSLCALNWFSLGPSLGAMVLMGALAFQASFRLFQIERRELVDVGEWLAAPGSWVPAPFQVQTTEGSRRPSRRG